MSKQNAARYKRLHNWYYLYRDSTSPEKIETNFKLRQRVLKACLEEALEGKPLSKLVVRALNDSMNDVLGGYYNLLTSPVDIGRGNQGLHQTDVTMIRAAVGYILLCKDKTFSRKNHIDFVARAYGVHRSSVQRWIKNKEFSELNNEPYPFPSQETAENLITHFGEIYQNGSKQRHKA